MAWPLSHLDSNPRPSHSELTLLDIRPTYTFHYIWHVTTSLLNNFLLPCPLISTRSKLFLRRFVTKGIPVSQERSWGGVCQVEAVAWLEHLRDGGPVKKSSREQARVVEVHERGKTITGSPRYLQLWYSQFRIQTEVKTTNNEGKKLQWKPVNVITG